MKQSVHNLRTAYGLFRSDSREETLAAVVVAGATLGPLLYQYYRYRKGGS